MILRRMSRYLRPGTSMVLVLSAVIIPLWIWISTAHAVHWVGGQLSDTWSALIRPWGGRMWALVIVLAISGWTAWYESIPPLKLSPMVDRLVGAIIVLGLAAAVAAPTWSWLAQVGALTPIEVLGTASLACLPPLAAVVSSSLSRVWLRPNVSMPIGMCLGLMCLGLLWESMQ
ncbi:MAG: hypothetical protein VX589_20655 [Myxococcota bacterium]|nr:hypothetical protein [Myxococcota bacterium]